MALSRPLVVQRHGHLPIWLIRAYPWAKQFPTYGPNNELSILVSMGLGVLSFSERLVQLNQVFCFAYTIHQVFLFKLANLILTDNNSYKNA